MKIAANKSEIVLTRNKEIAILNCYSIYISLDNLHTISFYNFWVSQGCHIPQCVVGISTQDLFTFLGKRLSKKAGFIASMTGIQNLIKSKSSTPLLETTASYYCFRLRFIDNKNTHIVKLKQTLRRENINLVYVSYLFSIPVFSAINSTLQGSVVSASPYFHLAHISLLRLQNLCSRNYLIPSVT